jgi:hypothetical protein
MTALHGRQLSGGACSSGPVCFGPSVKNRENDLFLFTAVMQTANIVTGYTQAFPTGTNIFAAQTEILRWMPIGSTASPLVVDRTGGSCGLYNIDSSTLATIFGDIPAIGDASGVVGVELGYDDAGPNITYNPKNIESATITLGPTHPSSACPLRSAQG